MVTGRDNLDDAQAVLEQLRAENARLRGVLERRDEQLATSNRAHHDALAREAGLVAALSALEQCVCWSDTMQQWTLSQRVRDVLGPARELIAADIQRLAKAALAGERAAERHEHTVSRSSTQPGTGIVYEHCSCGATRLSDYRGLVGENAEPKRGPWTEQPAPQSSAEPVLNNPHLTALLYAGAIPNSHGEVRDKLVEYITQQAERAAGVEHP